MIYKVKSRLRHTSWLERITAIIIIAVLIFGLSQIGHGVYIKMKASLAQVLLERAFAQSLEDGKPAKPWPWADTWPVARLDAPRLNKSAIVLKGASGEAMAFGPGHMDGTPLPGQSGTAVFSAHRDTHFEFLKDIKKGDELNITLSGGSTHNYRVTDFEVVNAGASGIEPLAPGNNLALVTCWPFNSNKRGPLRFIVHARGIKFKLKI